MQREFEWLINVPLNLHFICGKEVIDLQFEYYVLNYDTNKKKVENFNIFRNCLVQEHTEKAVRKYLRKPKS